MSREVWLCFLFLVTSVLAASQTTAQSPEKTDEAPRVELSPEEIKAQRIAKKFQQLLERNPRFGTALDRFYGHHAERGTLDELIDEYTARTSADESDGKAWMMIALIQARRGRDKECIAAFQAAEKSRPEDALAPLYLAQRLMLSGLPDQAAEAFERALKNKPSRPDQLEAYQTLGRIHQRAGRSEEALDAWNRLEKAFPRDLKVQESIAAILVEENQLEDALKRYEGLIKKTRDNYSRVQFGIRAAEIKQRLGRKPEAIQQFESLLANLKPESWLHRDVRDRIEESFRQSFDYDGLIQYYEGWLKTHTDDIDAMGRVAQILSNQSRKKDAEVWFNRALKLAPGNTTLRTLLINQLEQEGEFAAAIREYEQLDEQDPGNPDHIRRWGELILKDASRSVAKQKSDAANVWKKLLVDKEDDPVSITTVADLMRTAKINDRAIELYRQAIELAPEEPRYREHLGEFFHSLNRRDDAVKTWEEIAGGTRRNTRNLVRLAEVFNGFGYPEKAIAAMKDACDIEPDFSDLIAYSRMHRDATNYDDSLSQISRAEKLAGSEEEQDLILTERIETWQLSETLEDEIVAMRRRLEKNPKATGRGWFELALCQEAAMRPEAAAKAIFKATELDTKSIKIWSAAARLTEKTGNLRGAVTTLRKLVDIDRRFRSAHLTKIASLELQMGKTEAAIETGRELLAAAPDNPEHFRFYANLCFQANKEDLGLDALRRSVHVNPSDEESLLALATALSQRFRTAEAIEVYWRAFENARKLDDRLAILGPLADLHSRSNQIERLVRRIELFGRENNQPRETAYCLAATYRHISDPGTARQILEKLLVNNRDVALLQQLVQLAESDGDLELAVDYQKQVVEVAPTDVNVATLAKLYRRSGNYDESEKTWMKLLDGEQDRSRLLTAIDDLISYDQFDSALKLIARIKQAEPRDWEVLTRESTALWKAGQKEKAAEPAKQILALALEDDEKATQQQEPRGKFGGFSGMGGGFGFSLAERPPLVKRMQAARSIANGLGDYLRPRAPKDFGEARMFALAILHLSPGNAHQETLQQIRDRADNTSSPRALRDVFYLESIRSSSGWMYQSQPELQLAARKLSAEDNLETAAACLEAYADRSRYSDPLQPEEIQHLRKCYRVLHEHRETMPRLCGQMVEPVLAELRRAGQDQAANELYAEVIESATDAAELEELLRHVRRQRDLKSSLMVADKLEAAYIKRGSAPDQLTTTYGDLFRWFVPDLVRDDERQPLLDLLQKHLETMSQRFETGLRSAANRRRFAALNSTVMGTIFRRGPRYRFISLNYPRPGSYFNRDAILMLRNVYDVCADDDAIPELIAVLKDGLSKSSNRGTALYHLALAYVSRWEENMAGWEQEIENAIASVPDDITLRIELAQHYLRRQNAAGEDASKNVLAALEVVDAVKPIDPGLLQKREMFVLSLAGVDKKRKRAAAEALMGLRLDRKTQERLGPLLVENEFMDLVESLAGKVGPVNPVARMHEQLEKGKPELAAEIAFDVLRRARGPKQQKVRAEAIKVLSDVGRMEQMIDRMKGQLSRSPRSYRLRQRLADYLTGVGRQDEAWKVYEELATAGTGNARVNYQLAEQFRARKKYDSAADLYLVALKSNFSLMGSNYRYVEPVFASAKRSDEFYDLLMQSDLKRLGSVTYLSRTIATYTNNTTTREKGLKLLKYACSNWPEQRATLLGGIGQQINQKDVFELCVETILPDETSTLLSPWQGLELSNLISQMLAMNTPRLMTQGSLNSGYIVTVPTPVLSSSPPVPVTTTRVLGGTRLQRGSVVVPRSGLVVPQSARTTGTSSQNSAKALSQYSKILQSMEAQLGKSHPKVIAIRQRIAELSKSTKASNSNSDQLAKKIAELQQQRKQLQNQLGANHPQLLALQQRIDELQGKPKPIEKSENLKYFEKQIRACQQQHPQWLAGDVLLSAIDLATDNEKDAAAKMEQFVDDNLGRMPVTAMQQIGTILNRINKLPKTVIRLYETHTTQVAARTTTNLMSGPAFELISLYHSQGQRSKAREQATQLWKTRDYSGYSSTRAGYREYRELYDASRMAPQLRALGLHIVAFQVCRDIQQSPALLTNAKKYSSTSTRYHATCTKEYSLALNSINQESLVPALKDLISENGRAADYGLPISVFTSSAGLPRSLFGEALTAASKDPSVDFQPIIEFTNQQAADKPHDVHLAVNYALARLADPNKTVPAAQVQQDLLKFIDAHPLESAENSSLNARQRNKALQQVSLWLVAEKLLLDSETRETGGLLAQRALKAAQVSSSSSTIYKQLQARLQRTMESILVRERIQSLPADPPAPTLPVNLSASNTPKPPGFPVPLPKIKL